MARFSRYGSAACCEEWLCLSVKPAHYSGLRPYLGDGVRGVESKIMARLQRLGAQPDSKWHVYGKAEPFLTTGGGAVPNDDGLVAALLRCASSVFFVTLWWWLMSNINRAVSTTASQRTPRKKRSESRWVFIETRNTQ